MFEVVDQNNPPPLTEFPCYGQPRPITLSWSRLSDWLKCSMRVRLIYEGKKTKHVNARNFLSGKVADLSMREALDNAKKDEDGRLLSLSMDELLAPLPMMWEKSTQNLEKNTIMKWNGTDPREDQKKLLSQSKKALKNLHPILEENLIGRRFIPEFRPKEMPVIGIPGPTGETVYIRLFLAVDCAVQIWEDPNNPDALGEWGLYDLKTSPTVEYLEKTLPQLVFYDLAFRAMTGKNAADHALWAPLVNPPVKQVNVTDDHRKMVMNWIINYCHGVWAGESDLTKEESNCYNCSTKNACPKNVIPITKDEQGISRVYFGGEGLMR